MSDTLSRHGVRPCRWIVTDASAGSTIRRALRSESRRNPIRDLPARVAVRHYFHAKSGAPSHKALGQPAAREQLAPDERNVRAEYNGVPLQHEADFGAEDGRIPDFPVTRSHPPASWPSAANSSICRTL